MISSRLIRAALMALVIPAAAFAQETPRSPILTPFGTLNGIEGMTSTVIQEGQSSFSGLGLRARFQSPRLMEQVEIMPTIEWWRNSNTVRPFDIQTTRKDFTVGTDARWNFTTPNLKPYLGAGFGIHFLSNKVQSPTFNGDDSVTKGALALLGGVSFALNGRLDNFIDVKYHHLTDYRQLKINWGLTYNL